MLWSFLWACLVLTLLDIFYMMHVLRRFPGQQVTKVFSVFQLLMLLCTVLWVMCFLLLIRG